MKAPSDTLGKMIELVSDNPDPNRERERAKRHLDYLLRDLAANIMRVCAGAGRPENIPGQLVELPRGPTRGISRKDQRVRKEYGRIPNALGVQRLRPGPNYFADNITLEERHDRRRAQRIAEAEEHIIKSALRMAAARLTENATQKYKSYHEMFEAMRKREEPVTRNLTSKKKMKWLSRRGANLRS